MRSPEINDLVVLLEDLPNLGLEFGDVGRVRNRWSHPSPAYEVEFYCEESNTRTRAVLPPERLQLAPVSGLPSQTADPREALF
jgi:hypothetical protein